MVHSSSPAQAAAVPAGAHATPFLAVTGIARHYDGVKALDGVDMAVKPGEVVALAGENGSGKSTLIKVIAAVERPDAGAILINGADVTGQSPAARIAAGIQIIYQDFALFPNLSVAENIWLPQHRNQHRLLVDRRTGATRAALILRDIGIDLDLDKPVGELSVAQKQMVAIGRALVNDARLLILDEPTTALTHREVHNLFDVIRRLAANGMSFVFVSHKLHEVAEICSRVVVLRNGLKTLDARLDGLSESQIALAMTGRHFDAARRHAARTDLATPLLSVRGLSREPDYSDITFDLAAGEVLGIAGLMGAGRTALARGLFGLPPADGGTISIAGSGVRLVSAGDAIRAGIGYVSEDRLSEGLFLDFSIEDNIAVRALDRIRTSGGWITRSRKAAEASHWVKRLSIKTPSPALPASSLSGGNQQRVVLAKWMAGRPRILILNRPTVGVDVGSKADIHDIILDLAAEGLGIIVISDEISELMRVCDRILVMRGGRIVAERTASETPEGELLDIVSEIDA